MRARLLSQGEGPDAGRRIRIKWNDDASYEGVVIDSANGMHTICYDDGDRWMEDLSDVTHEWLTASPVAATRVVVERPTQHEKNVVERALWVLRLSRFRVAHLILSLSLSFYLFPRARRNVPTRSKRASGKKAGHPRRAAREAHAHRGCRRSVSLSLSRNREARA